MKMLIHRLTRAGEGLLGVPGVRLKMWDMLYGEIARANLRLVPTSQLLAEVRLRGWGIRTQDAYRMARAETGRRDLFEAQRAMPADEPLPVSALPESKLHLTRKYQYTFKMKLIKSGQEEPTVEEIRFRSNKLMSPDEAAGAFRSEFDDVFSEREADWSTLEFTGAYQRGKEI